MSKTTDNQILAEYTTGRVIVNVPGHIPSENIGTKVKPCWVGWNPSGDWNQLMSVVDKIEQECNAALPVTERPYSNFELKVWRTFWSKKGRYGAHLRQGDLPSFADSKIKAVKCACVKYIKNKHGTKKAN